MRIRLETVAGFVVGRENVIARHINTRPKYFRFWLPFLVYTETKSWLHDSDIS